MPFLLPILAAIGSGAAGAAGTAAGALGSAASTVGGALGSAGSAIGSGLAGAAGKLASAVPNFMGAGGGGEAGKIAAMGQSVPSGVSFAGPSTPVSPAEASIMTGAQAGTPSSSVMANLPPNFAGSTAAGSSAGAGGMLAKLQQLQQMIAPFMQNQPQQAQNAQDQRSGGIDVPDFQPSSAVALRDDPLAFLQAFYGRR